MNIPKRTSADKFSGSTVVVLGASAKKERYSNMAVKMLLEGGYQVVPVHPRGETICGCTSVRALSEVTQPVDTLTVYVNENRSSQLIEEILALNPRRLILNPGAESPRLEQAAADFGIEVLNACTLVMLRTGQF